MWWHLIGIINALIKMLILFILEFRHVLVVLEELLSEAVDGFVGVWVLRGYPDVAGVIDHTDLFG